jgi:hypothetical protein
MSNDRPTRDSMSIEEATISNMWEMAAVVEALQLNSEFFHLACAIGMRRTVLK